MASYPERYFDDFKVGDTFTTESVTLRSAESLEFAERYDPQPFHLDEEAGRASLFRRLAVSGWQTAAVTMRLIVRSGYLRGPGVIGTGIDELRWLAPVYPGDTLRVGGEILELLPDAAGKRRGRMRSRIHTYNQDNVEVMTYIANLSVIGRPTAARSSHE
jgi:acyl dehydratase